MNDEARLLESKFSELLDWERVKRREANLLRSFCCAAFLSLIVLPVSGVMAPGVNPLLFLPLFFAAASLAVFLLRPWRPRDSLKAVLAADKGLRLEERAVTAWEILARKRATAAERLVLEEAWRKLEAVDPKAVFKSERGWPAAAAPLLLAVWILAAWFQDELSLKAYLTAAPAGSAARSAKEYAQSLQEKAKAEGLRESLKAARALEELAEKRLRDESREEAFLDGLARLMKGIGAQAGIGPRHEAGDLAAATREGLSDLKSEIESLRQSLQFPGLKNAVNPGLEVAERLAGLPQLRKEVESGKNLGAEKLQPGELEALLERLEKLATEELDRRALEELNDFLASIAGGGERGDGSEQARSAAGEETEKQARTQGKGTAEMPGRQPGSGEDANEPPPAVALNPSSHLKGLLREGETRSASVKGAGRANESRVETSDVSASYERQVEEDLAAEEIPDGVKETIRKYFLSLGMGAGTGR